MNPDQPSDLGPTDTSSTDLGDSGATHVPTGGAQDAKHRQQPAAIWPIKRLEVGRSKQILDGVVARLTRWGLVPHTYLMTTKGRKTGQLRSTPVTLVEKGDRRWLVAPYGPVPWVLNARAAGRVTISRRGRSQDYEIAEVAVEQAGPILKDYLKIASATKSYFQATKTSPVAAFTAEAGRHPVFTLTPLADSRG